MLRAPCRVQDSKVLRKVHFVSLWVYKCKERVSVALLNV